MTSKDMKENDFMYSIISLKARRTETPRTNVNYKGEVITNPKYIFYNLNSFSVLLYLLFSLNLFIII